MLLYSILFMMLGFVGLYFGGKYTIIGLESIAKRFGLSHLMVGLTILAIGTSLPEIAVSIIGGFDKILGIDPNIDGIVIGNKIGSFFTQITFILGLLGLTQTLFISKWELRREGPMLFLSLFVFLLFAIDGLIDRIEALAMIIIYIIYLILIIISEKKLRKAEPKVEEIEKERLDPLSLEVKKDPSGTTSIKKDIIICLIGLLFLLIGAEICILSGHNIANELNVPNNVIGILIIGLGTSIPELVVDLTAMRRGSYGLAIGDILGSNICDILFATGAGAIIAEFNVVKVLLLYDIPMLFIAISIAYYFLWTKKSLKTREAIFLISFYAFYVTMKLVFFQI
ncbi:MAG: calcium/sodium antiporter [Candidatus Lokiarchaeota archaeon]|nr:calcium/sodium antiporter [Candidatus Lokiarchaeota archaeon]